MRARLAHLAGCGWFWIWALIGGGAILAALSLGPLFLWPVLVGAAVLTSSPRFRRSSFGLLTGAGALCLSVAWVQRRGPGEVCWQKTMSSGCDTYADPRPWLAFGVLLVLAGIVGHTVRSRRTG